MAGETEVATTVTHSGLWAGSLKPFLIAHPVGVAIIGGALVGTGVYFLAKKFSKPKVEEEEAVAAAA
ncbi:MAG: hypothetical protein DRR08_26555 [Candidatus Parabeggiatoa sp. nov. 2]|nr:MAG: hypothetical protein B6247_08850 [Beggiatoa sp. 4572_84]RKZ54347.1 MAG: hypothetical protein DRR08_26555 [Gammaproteobacteria bacterium]